jgi:hypothetical protein
MAILGIGSKIGYSTDGGSTFTDVAEVTSITLPSSEHSVIDVVHLGITDGYKDFLFGLADGGTVEFKFNYTATVYSALFALKGQKKTGANDNKWKISGPDENGVTAGGVQTFTFKGVLMALESEIMTEEIVGVTGKVKVCGGVTVA